MSPCERNFYANKVPRLVKGSCEGDSLRQGFHKSFFKTIWHYVSHYFENKVPHLERGK